MKKYIIVLILIVPNTLVFSQLGLNFIPKKGTGMFITTSGDTIQGNIKVWVENPYAIKKISHIKGKKEKIDYAVTELSYLRFFSEGNISGVFVQKRVPSTKDTLMLKPIAKGAVTLYPFEELSTNAGAIMGANGVMIPGGSIAVKTYFLEKDGQWIGIVKRGNYKQLLRMELSDCPDLIRKIGRGGYKYGDMMKIIKVYNNCVQP